MADSNLRAEIYAGDPSDGTLITASTLDLSKDSPTIWAPNYGQYASDNNPPKTLVLYAFMFSAFVAVGPTPNASVEPRRVCGRNRRVEMRVRAGDKLSALASLDA